ncbi:MAG: hypothetical protein Q4G02_03790 [bacterium]|nr:hypothetical protein [bacterium]
MRKIYKPWQAGLAQVASIAFLLLICGSQMGSHGSWVFIGYGLMTFWDLQKSPDVSLLSRPALPLMALQATLMMQTHDLGLVRLGLLLAPLGYWLAAKVVQNPTAVARIKRLPFEIGRLLIVALLIAQIAGFGLRLGNSQLQFNTWSWLLVIVLLVNIVYWVKNKHPSWLLLGLAALLSFANGMTTAIFKVDDLIVNASWSGFFGGLLAPAQLSFWQQLIAFPRTWSWSILLFPVATFLMGLEVYITLLTDSLGNPDAAADNLAPSLKRLSQKTLLAAILVIPVPTLSIESAATRFCFQTDSPRNNVKIAAWWLVGLGLMPWVEEILIKLPQQLYALFALMCYGLLIWLAVKPACLTIWQSLKQIWSLIRRQPRHWPARNAWRLPILVLIAWILVSLLPRIYLFNYQIEISQLWFYLGIGLLLWQPIKRLFS